MSSVSKSIFRQTPQVAWALRARLPARRRQNPWRFSFVASSLVANAILDPSMRFKGINEEENRNNSQGPQATFCGCEIQEPTVSDACRAAGAKVGAS
jgi:hypothetical protein